MDIDFSFMDNEDFGLAKSFSTAPVSLIAPQISLASKEQVAPEKEYTEVMEQSEIRADGFCFKLAPTEDQV